MSTTDEAYESAVTSLLAPEEETPEVETDAEEAPLEEEATDAEEVETEEAADEADDETDDEEAEADDPPEPERIKVKVDGQEVEVTLDDLKRSYSGQEYIQKGMQEAAALKKRAEEAYNTLQSEQARFLEFVQSAQAEGFKQPPKAPDAALLDKDPIGYFKAKEAYDRQMGEYQSQQQQIRQMQERQQHVSRQAQQAFLAEQAEVLQRAIPEFANPETAARVKDELLQYGRSQGFDDSELMGVMDARAVMMLHKAQKYDALLASKAKAKKAPEAPRNVKPAARRPEPAQLVRKKQIEQAKRSGSLADFADLLIKK